MYFNLEFIDSLDGKKKNFVVDSFCSSYVVDWLEKYHFHSFVNGLYSIDKIEGVPVGFREDFHVDFNGEIKDYLNGDKVSN